MIQALAVQFNAGGTFMWVILAVFGFAIAVALERVIYYFIYCNDGASKVIGKVLEAVQKNDMEQAKKIVNRRKTPFYNLLKTAIDRYASGAKVERIMDSVERVSISELPRISRRLNYLALIANIATLVGLLGTIVGLQTSFGSLASTDAAQKAAQLANGIAEAMNTTAFGLIVAVPSMVLYTILSNKQQSLIKDIDRGIAMFVDTVKEVRG
jgi:biopolymer transport protein ExbB/TolQ